MKKSGKNTSAKNVQHRISNKKKPLHFFGFEVSEAQKN